MLKKAIVGAVAAGAISVPLAGAAWADHQINPGDNGNGLGKGGVPAVVGSLETPPMAKVAPGQEVRDAQQVARSKDYKNLNEYLASGQATEFPPGYTNPGGLISDIARGQFPPPAG